MNFFQRLAELPPSIRYHRSKLWTDLVLRRAFAHIGTGSVLIAPETLQRVDGISIGDHCAIQEHAWLACEFPHSHITIGDHVVLGRGTHVHAGSDITIGSYFQTGPNGVIISAAKGTHDRLTISDSGPIIIGENVSAGEGVAILGGVTIGDGATIGAGAVVTRDVEPGAVVAGVPARAVTSRPGR